MLELEKLDVSILSLGQVSPAHGTWTISSRIFTFPSAHWKGQHCSHFYGYWLILVKPEYCWHLGKRCSSSFFPLSPTRDSDRQRQSSFEGHTHWEQDLPLSLSPLLAPNCRCSLYLGVGTSQYKVPHSSCISYDTSDPLPGRKHTV